jgi:hypothetical protein
LGKCKGCGKYHAHRNDLLHRSSHFATKST